MRILLVHNYYKIPGGEDTVVANEKRLLEEQGHQVVLYARSNGEMENFSLRQKVLLPFTSLFSLRTYREVRSLIATEGFDVVHVHNTLSLVSPSVYYAAFSRKVPVVQTLHNFRMLCPAATFLREGNVCEDCVEKGLWCAVKHGCYRGSKAQSLMSAMILKLHRLLGTYKKVNYICLTEFNKSKLLAELSVPKSRVFVKPNFVKDLMEIQAQKQDYYIYVGRLELLKGIRPLLEAWTAFPDKTLLLCGSGPEEGWVRSFLEEHQLENVKVMGQVEHEALMKMIAEARALILPTLCYEGQPMVIMESYAVGTPVIASDLGNAGNMVIPGKTGERFAVGNPEALRKAVLKLEETGGYNTIPVYEQFYTEEQNYTRLYEIYKRVQEQK